MNGSILQIQHQQLSSLFFSICKGYIRWLPNSLSACGQTVVLLEATILVLSPLFAASTSSCLFLVYRTFELFSGLR